MNGVAQPFLQPQPSCYYGHGGGTESPKNRQAKKVGQRCSSSARRRHLVSRRCFSAVPQADWNCQALLPGRRCSVEQLATRSSAGGYHNSPHSRQLRPRPRSSRQARRASAGTPISPRLSGEAKASSSLHVSGKGRSHGAVQKRGPHEGVKVWYSRAPPPCSGDEITQFASLWPEARYSTKPTECLRRHRKKGCRAQFGTELCRWNLRNDAHLFLATSASSWHRAQPEYRPCRTARWSSASAPAHAGSSAGEPNRSSSSVAGWRRACAGWQ